MIISPIVSVYHILCIAALVLLLSNTALAQPQCIGDGCPGSTELNVVGVVCGVTYCSRQFAFDSQASLENLGFAYDPLSTTYTGQYTAYLGLYASGGDSGPKTLLVNRSVGVPFGHNPSLPAQSWTYGGSVSGAWFCFNGFAGTMLPNNYYAACLQIECEGNAQGGGPLYHANAGNNPSSKTNLYGPPPQNFTTTITVQGGSFDVQAYYVSQSVGGFCATRLDDKDSATMTWWEGLLLLLVIGAIIAGVVFAYQWYMKRSEYQPIDPTSH